MQIPWPFGQGRRLTMIFRWQKADAQKTDKTKVVVLGSGWGAVSFLKHIDAAALQSDFLLHIACLKEAPSSGHSKVMLHYRPQSSCCLYQEGNVSPTGLESGAPRLE